VEVVARALNYEDGEFSWELTTAGIREWYSNLAQVALTAAVPLIRADALEEAATLLDAEADAYRKTGLVPELVDAATRLAAAIRALKEQP
jgi:hypothetical protein